MYYLLLFSESDFTNEFDYLMRGKESLRLETSLPEMSGLTKEQVSNKRMIFLVTQSVTCYFYRLHQCIIYQNRFLHLIVYHTIYQEMRYGLVTPIN